MPEEKQCSKCKEIKSINLFHKDKSTKDGFNYTCIPCRKTQDSNYKNKPGVADIKYNTRKIWTSKNKDKVLQSTKKYQSGIYHSLKCKYGDVIRCALKTKNNRYVDILGCTSLEFQVYISNQFKPEMNWSNYSTLWTLDHIIPIRAFEIENYDEVRKAYHYSNTRPLLVEENTTKMDKLPSGELARNNFKKEKTNKY